MTRPLLIVIAALLISACDQLGLGPDPRVAQREADAKAVGAACRHGLRSIEDCYNLNKGISKSAIYAGWREMDEYMRENKIEGIRSEAQQPASPSSQPASAEEILPEHKVPTGKP